MSSFRKRFIDSKHKHERIRRLFYWAYANDPDCAAEIDDGYTAGNKLFADDVAFLLSEYEKLLATIEKTKG